MSTSHQPLPSSVFAFTPVAELPDVSATNLKNKFSEVARRASRAPLAVTRHQRREFVILTAERYEELQQNRHTPLESLSAEFDQLVARMNSPKAKRAADVLFAADAEALGEASVKSTPRAAHA